MNLAVHGLEGDIQQAITYYEDPHELLRKADYVMANPPFNVDEIDADKVKTDPASALRPARRQQEGQGRQRQLRLDQLLLQLFERTDRAGFVMSSQASSAGRDEAKVRRKLVETGDVDDDRYPLQLFLHPHRPL
jgi:type I restriction enzyme M protein